MGVNGRMREDMLANNLLLFEYLRDILGPPPEPSPVATTASLAAALLPVQLEGKSPLCLHHTGTPRLPSKMRAFGGLSQPPVANSFASNRFRRRNSKPDNSCVTSQGNSFSP